MAITTAKQTLEALAERFADTLNLGQDALDVVMRRLTEAGLEVLEQRDAAIVELLAGTPFGSSDRHFVREAARKAGLIR